MRSIQYQRTKKSLKTWKQFWDAADGIVERCRAGIEDTDELRFVSIDVRTGSVTVFYEERRVVLPEVTVITADGTTTGDLMSDDSIRVSR